MGDFIAMLMPLIFFGGAGLFTAGKHYGWAVAWFGLGINSVMLNAVTDLAKLYAAAHGVS